MLVEICTANPAPIHGDMGTFVGFMLGILTCASFWDKPRTALLKVILSWHISVKEKYSDELMKSCLPDNEKAQKTEWLTNDYIDIFGDFNKKILFGHRWIYFPLAFICVILGSFELFFSLVTIWGYINGFLLIPPAFYLLYCFFHSVKGRRKQHNLFQEIRSYCKVKQKEETASQMRENSDKVARIMNLIDTLKLN